MRAESDGWPVWSDPTDELLWHSLLKSINAGCRRNDSEVSEHTEHHSLLHMGPRSHSVPAVTPVCRRESPSLAMFSLHQMARGGVCAH